MEKKVESGELTEESLKAEAGGMMGKMGENEMFKNMMGQMNPEEMRQAPAESPSAESSVEEVVPEPELSREEKSRRLREKIAEKRKNR